ncbi:hypothetical protein Dimus_034731 [Dionaea muscipula]
MRGVVEQGQRQGPGPAAVEDRRIEEEEEEEVQDDDYESEYSEDEEDEKDAMKNKDKGSETEDDSGWLQRRTYVVLALQCFVLYNARVGGFSNFKSDYYFDIISLEKSIASIPGLDRYIHT